VTRTTRRLLVVLAGGAAVFAAVSIYGDVSELRSRLAGYAWWTFAAALGLALTNYALRYARWALYLRHRGIEVPQRTSALVFLSGFALSITPGKVGELIKSYLLRAILAIPIARSAPIVVAERVTDLVALLLLGLLGVALYGIAGSTVAAGGALVLAGLVVLAWPGLSHRLIDAVTGPRRLARYRPRLREVYDGLAALVRPWPLSWATALGVLAWLAECVGFALIVSGFADTHVPLALAILIYASTTVAGALSFLPGGLVVTDAGMTWLLHSARGADQATAAAATILTRLATLWFAVVLGLIALALLRRHAPAASRTLDGDVPTEEA
jgi:glycosyltransferase 2 family protein